MHFKKLPVYLPTTELADTQDHKTAENPKERTHKYTAVNSTSLWFTFEYPWLNVKHYTMSANELLNLLCMFLFVKRSKGNLWDELIISSFFTFSKLNKLILPFIF